MSLIDSNQPGNMKTIRIFPLRILAAAAVSATLMTGFTLSAHAESDTTQQMKQDWAQHRQEHIKVRLAKMAERLEIKSSQQNEWQAYVKVIEESTSVPHMARASDADADADAATLTRKHADFAAAHARKLAAIADATAKLQSVLTPEQRKTLDQMARHFHRGKHHDHLHGDRRRAGER
jgi:cell pole-organizing protein PopZ